MIQSERGQRIFGSFRFTCNGMNFNDVARLQYSDIKTDSINYVRQKTKEAEENEEVIEIPLNDTVKEILVELGNPDKRPGSFIFDILVKGLSHIDQRKVINQKLKVVNKWLKKLCMANDLAPITTYWARHSYCFVA